MKFGLKVFALVMIFSLLLSGCNRLVGQNITTVITEETEETVTSSKKNNTSSKKENHSSTHSNTSTGSSHSSTFTGTQISIPEGVTSSELPTSSEIEITDAREAYSALNNTQKKVYAIIKGMLENLTEGLVKVPTESEADITVAYKAVNIDYPEYFWMPLNYIFAVRGDSYMIAMKYSDSNYEFDYLYPKTRIVAMQGSIKTKTQEFLKTIEPTDSDYEKELKIHNYLCENVIYPIEYGEDYHFNIYGALVKGSAVCEGYSRAFQYLCRQVEIPCILVTGSSKSEGHMWNQVKIEGKWYNIDLTWDDANSKDYVWYSYFNLDDNAIKIDHTFNPIFTALSDEDIANDIVQFNIVKYTCTSTDYNYAIVNDILLTNDREQNRYAATSAFSTAFLKGTGYVDFYISNEVFLGGTKEDELFDFFYLGDAFERANLLVANSGKGPFTRTISVRNGTGFRIYYE